MDKILENKLRRHARRRGQELKRSRRRDKAAFDYGTYYLVEPRTWKLIAPKGRGGRGFTEAEIVKRLLGVSKRKIERSKT